MKIKSIGENHALNPGYHIWDNPIIKVGELREEVVDETRRLEQIKELNKSNQPKNSTKGKYINIIV